MAILTVAQFKAQFNREFPYGDTTSFVMEADITQSLNEATMMFNEGLWADDTSKKIAYGYCAAHFLVLKIQRSGGLAGGQGLDSRGNWITQAKSVDSISETYKVPESLAEDRVLSQFMTTGYGQAYLHFLAPMLVGNMGIVSSWRDDNAIENS